jgi:hypothetical protein
MESSI